MSNVVTLSLMSNADHEVGEKRHAASDARDGYDHGGTGSTSEGASEAARTRLSRPMMHLRSDSNTRHQASPSTPGDFPFDLPKGLMPLMIRDYILHDVEVDDIDGYAKEKLVLLTSKASSGFANVEKTSMKHGDKYEARMGILGYIASLGQYNTAQDAAKVMAIARIKLEAHEFLRSCSMFSADWHSERERLIAMKPADLKKEAKAEAKAAAAAAAVLRKQARDAEYTARLDRETQRRAERKDLEAERKLMKAAEEESKRAEHTALKAAEREERLMEFGPRVAERAVATWGWSGRTDVFSYPLYWIEPSTIDELNRVMQRFLDIVFRRNFSILPIASKAQRESCATLLTKRLEVPELECVTVAKSIFLLLSPNSTDSEESFILHGLVQTRGHDVARDHLNATARRYLGNSVEVFGLTWRFITFKMGDITPQGNTAPHYDTFSGYQLLISFTLEGTFTLQITKGTKVIAFGPQEQARRIQVMVMAGAHSHERILNPCKLLHSGIPSQGCKRLLLRMSLKGVPDEGILENCDFLELAKAMATLKASGAWNQRLKFMRAG